MSPGTSDTSPIHQDASRRIKIGTTLAAVGLLGLGVLSLPAVESAAQQQSNFMGGQPTVEEAEGVRTIRILFPAGVRSNWHTHTEGQLLMIEEGTGRTQVRGQASQDMSPGIPWYTAAGVEHWHGAAPDQDALQLTIYSGSVDWLEPVTDEVYTAAPGR